MYVCCVLACSHLNGGHTLTYNNAPFSTTLVWGTDGDLISIPLMLGVICTITIISQFFFHEHLKKKSESV